MGKSIIIEIIKGNKKCLLKYNENYKGISIQADKEISLDSFELAKAFGDLSIDLEAIDRSKSTAEKGFLDTAVKYACISGDTQTTII